jgi:hypothetical protein
MKSKLKAQYPKQSQLGNELLQVELRLARLMDAASEYARTSGSFHQLVLAL